MKFLAVFAALAAVAVAFPAAPAMGVPSHVTTWTLQEISEALQNPNTDPALVPHLEQALNDLMEAMWNPVGPAIANPAMDLSTWTLAELDAALSNPDTNPELLPFLITALNEYMAALFAGEQLGFITIVTPAGLLPVTADVDIIIPTPVVVPESVLPTPVLPTPVLPEPEATPAGRPLVQLIINVNAQAGAPSPIVPEPIIIGPQPVIPDPIIVHPEPVIIPEPIIIGPEPVNPGDIIAINPPEVNPIDIINPVPEVHPGQDIIGPIV